MMIGDIVTPCSRGNIKIVSYLVPWLTVLTWRQTITEAESQNKILFWAGQRRAGWRKYCWKYWILVRGVSQSERKNSIISRKLLKEWRRDKHQRRIQISRYFFTRGGPQCRTMIYFDSGPAWCDCSEFQEFRPLPQSPWLSQMSRIVKIKTIM